MVVSTVNVILQNRAFQLVTPGSSAALSSWSAINGATISVVRDTTPISNALPNALHVVIPSGRTGGVGFANAGYSGISVTSGTTYTGSFFYRFPTSSSFRGSATVSLQSSTGSTLGSTTVTISGAQTSWAQVNFSVRAGSTPGNINNRFVVTLDGAAASGQTVNFGMFSLFPPTFRNRANGMRNDIASALAELGPGFWRFPGGNNLEGQTVAQRWQWNATVGPLTSRPGRQGDWGYINTDGLGLFEYLLWCEDLGMEPIMAVWSGFALGGTSIAQGQLGPYIQQAIDQINFVIGGTNTAPGQLRASLGHPNPFKLNFVEIGNEDNFAANTYTFRWTTIVNSLKAAFPQLHFIATTLVNNPVLNPKPTEYDVHVYQTPTWFAQNVFFYDDFARDGTKYFEGEYAAISTNPNDIFGSPSDGRLVFPTVQSAVGEAAFMTGLERNSDIVFAASFAPLLGHVTNNQWTPNLLAFDAGAVYRSTSFYVQRLFGQNRGDQYIPSTLPSRTGTAFWSVVRKTSSGQLVIKISNTATSAARLTFNLAFNNVATTGTATVITGNPTSSNTPTSPNLITPQTSSITTGKSFTYNAPAGLPRSSDRPAPSIPRRNVGPIQKRKIPHVKHVVAVASGKGGVGKSTVSVNLAYALATSRPRSKIGILDLDVFGPSIPKLMGLENIGEPDLTQSGALIPLTNNGIPTMSMGYLLPKSSANDAPVVWRGLMVQKAVQQLLFDVDWRRRTSQTGEDDGLDVLVLDMPPGTGDVQLTLSQLVKVDGAVIVSTPQDVALLDARKGVHMFRKVDVPVFGLVVNSAYFRCPSCADKHEVFGSLDSARRAVDELGLNSDGTTSGLLGELPMVSEVSSLGDKGNLGDIFLGQRLVDSKPGLKEIRDVMTGLANTVWQKLESSVAP
ncbi:hypothetical protein NP233_g3865 [Leucocoprinus birnbaumii]|uniref:non-reducing end alpha-L-arabinofuranosidase n=1 Tax=Leucocoprinus birnbaumii TaxID=56174 RepID=A0AAD5VX74_9AGAR|nr:hypothetical protein NP233_g3865 [Leucocoprinus birnbaumii]